MELFARFAGFKGTPEEWATAYGTLCGEYNTHPSDGISLEIFRQVVDDKSVDGGYCIDTQLQNILDLMTQKISNVEGPR